MQRLRKGLLLVIQAVAPTAVAADFYALEVFTTRKLKNYKPTRFMEKASHYDADAADYAVMFI